MNYDLSVAGPLSVTLTTSQVAPSGCFFDTEVWQVFDISDPAAEYDETTRMTHLGGSIDINIDTSILPSLHGYTRSYESRITITQSSTGTVFNS